MLQCHHSCQNMYTNTLDRKTVTAMVSSGTDHSEITDLKTSQNQEGEMSFPVGESQSHQVLNSVITIPISGV